jgi:formate-dependent nitrite reductase membrane component NrfD
LGGIAAGSSFMALGCDLAGDPGSARIARVVALTALAPCPPLLIADLGRPERFVHMLRVFKPRSPMSSGAWCLTLFGHLGAGAVAADVLARPRTARALGAANALVGGYLGSYTGVLLGSTAVPVWARSRLFLGPLFVATATATGAAATRLTVSARGLEAGHPTDVALGRIETAAMSCELLLAIVNERRLGPLRRHVAEGRSGAWFHAAKSAVRLGTVVRYASRGGRRPRLRHTASVLYLAAGLAFRWAWVTAGRASAQDSELVAAAARGRHG